MDIRVGHRTISLRPMDPGEASDNGAIGLFRPGAGTISVDSSQPADVQAEVAIHETIHAIWDAYGLPPKVDEEEAATLLAKGLAQVIRDNPELMLTIQDALEGSPIYKRKG
ncbi:MAG TPA: hypothetical protein VNR89_04010 [Roseomonas sp.]|nr:hypothetical protein [Roseomonas sp.]